MIIIMINIMIIAMINSMMMMFFDNHNHCHLFHLNGDNYGWRGFPCQDRDNDHHDNYHDNYHDNCHENHDIMIIAVIMILVSQSTPHFNGSDW